MENNVCNSSTSHNKREEAQSFFYRSPLNVQFQKWSKIRKRNEEEKVELAEHRYLIYIRPH